MSCRVSSLRRISNASVGSIPGPLQLRPYASVPTTPHCPAPTCTCAATPDPPVDADGKVLEINRDVPLKNTLAPFQHQVLLCTGRDDWPSRIEDEPGSGHSGKNVAWQLRDYLNNHVEACVGLISSIQLIRQYRVPSGLQYRFSIPLSRPLNGPVHHHRRYQGSSSHPSNI